MERIQVLKCAVCRNQGACFFSDADNTALKSKSSRFMQYYPKRHVLFIEGYPTHGVYVLCQGTVKLFKSDPKGRRITMHIARPVELLGSIGVLSNENYGATAVMLEESHVAYIDKATFLSLVSTNKGLMQNMLWFLARRVLSAEKFAIDVVTKSAHERIASTLLSLNESSQKTGAGRPAQPIAFTRLDLADMAGVAHETAVRILKQMARDKIVSLASRSISIIDSAALARMASESD